ncbi:MAG: Mur ligase family protein, partial [Candidatus Omnitrophica bacterium]|nr:Mur ligase family protein [Candidatus Omnitrophota bacterium]
MKNIKSGGCLITCNSGPNIIKIMKKCRRRIFTYSLAESDGPDIYPRDIRMDRFHTSYEAVLNKKSLGSFELNVPGRHNVENSLAVILLGLELGIDIKIIRRALSKYQGTARRFQVKADIDDIMVVEDYAHHPKEIMATIAACGNWPGRRIVGVFQPHRYTRTQFLKKEFGKSFLKLNELILTDIYPASEKPMGGVTTKIIYDEAVKNGQKNIHLFKKEKILPYLLKNLKTNDIVLILGAGDIGALSDELAEGLKTKRQGLLQRTAV